jgi:ABC-type lipoprotein release transport system permease subunit
VVGIYEAPNALYEEMNIYAPMSDIQSLLSVEGVHQVCVMLDNEKAVKKMADEIGEHFPNVKINTWKEIAPELALADQMLDFMLTLFLIIIMAALAFGIINTMMMAVLERKKELGVLQSIGMNKRRVFWMIVLESVFLCALALPLGILITWLLNQYFGRQGIDLTFATEGLKLVGIQSRIYPVIKPFYYIQISILVCVTAILSCINPALRALKMNPIESIRSI